MLDHIKLESTLRYLGIEVDDALEMAEQTESKDRQPGCLYYDRFMTAPRLPSGRRFRTETAGRLFPR